MNFEYEDFSFWADIYENDINDIELISNIVLKYLLDEDKSNQTYDSKTIGKELKKSYGLKIPSSLIEQSFRKLSLQYKENFNYKDDIFRLFKIPELIKGKYYQSKVEFENNVRIIKEEFNKAVGETDFTITQTEIIKSLDKIKFNVLRNTPIDRKTNQKELVFYDWIHYVFNSSDNSLAKEKLSKLILPLLIYYYFIEKEDIQTDLGKFKVIIDTNLLIHLIGANGEARKNITEEFFEFISLNKITIIISIETIKEFKETIKNAPNYQIRNFKNNNSKLITQIIENTKSYIESVLNSLNISYEYNNKIKQKNKENFKEWEELYSSLNSFRKGQPHKEAFANSIDHDINLIAISNCFKPIYNFHDHLTPIATADQKFVNWFNSVYSEYFGFESKSLIHFYKLILILWREGKKDGNSSFLAHTWIFLTENISYFNKEVTDNIFKIFREKSEKVHPVTGWKSTFLLLKNSIEAQEDKTNSEEDKIIQGLQNASITLNTDNVKDIATLISQKEILRNELEKEKEENKLLREKYKFVQKFLDFINAIIKLITSSPG
ncbi:hypothetical protein [Leptospira meyeri]|uniref:hypothetical protein n=1 Tax=Leptospira meyeri TaxID=29508 RepID=UPI0002BEE6E7|nr:hypothetical protein [Leptospira meyeri]EMJ85363.1 hypothetical protein LEP1GSC196_3998 [Leptospira meyeri serovar Semaranga str. Veldrot Semarang 173]